MIRQKCVNLVGITIFDDLCAEVAASNCAEVLLVALPIARVFVEHVWRSCLNLSADNVIPQPSSRHHLTTPTFSLIPSGH